MQKSINIPALCVMKNALCYFSAAKGAVQVKPYSSTQQQQSK